MKGLKANSSDSQIYQYFFKEKLLCVQPNLSNLMSSKSSAIYCFEIKSFKAMAPKPRVADQLVLGREITKCILVITQLAFWACVSQLT